MQLARFTQGADNRVQAFKREPIAGDYGTSTWVRPSSLLKSSGRKLQAQGIKEFAWKGISDVGSFGRLTHHKDKLFIEREQKRQDEMKSDNLPCGI